MLAAFVKTANILSERRSTVGNRFFICRSAVPQWETAFSFVEASFHGGKPLFHLSKRHSTVGNHFFICRSVISR
jgi:hypothetical protein